jgi:2-polyprenyl-6-hydroxyphenyl methylase/3-demethylubiquinone-9 3-methyltransferase
VNRTLKSWALAIVAAEYVLKLLERGTHDWNKFITPEELQNLLSLHGMDVEHIEGMFYNPLTTNCSFTRDLSVNYILAAKFKENSI